MVFVSSIGKYVFPVVMRVEQLLEHGLYSWAGPRSAIGRLDTRSGNILSFLLQFFSRRAVVSYWRKYVHDVLLSRLGGLSLPRKKCGYVN